MQIHVAQQTNCMHAWNTGKEYGVVLVFFGCFAACTHDDLLAEQRGLTEQITTATSKTKWLPVYYYYYITSKSDLQPSIPTTNQLPGQLVSTEIITMHKNKF